MHGTSYWITHEVRNAVAKKSGGKCFHCGQIAVKAEVNKRGVLVFYDQSGRIFHLDHKLPVGQGGAHDENNLVVSCASCNLSKRRRKVANDPKVKSLINRINARQ